MCFFVWLSEKCRQGGARKCWKDIIRKDLNDLKIPENSWYDSAIHLDQDLLGESITLPAWSLANCHMAMLIYKLSCAVTASYVQAQYQFEEMHC